MQVDNHLTTILVAEGTVGQGQKGRQAGDLRLAQGLVGMESRGAWAPRDGFEPPTRGLEVRCSFH
jgi:hypothetical protein